MQYGRKLARFREAKCGYLTGFLSAAEEAIDFYVRLAIEIFAQALGRSAKRYINWSCMNNLIYRRLLRARWDDSER